MHCCNFLLASLLMVSMFEICFFWIAGVSVPYMDIQRHVINFTRELCLVLGCGAEVQSDSYWTWCLSSIVTSWWCDLIYWCNPTSPLSFQDSQFWGRGHNRTYPTTILHGLHKGSALSSMWSQKPLQLPTPHPQSTLSLWSQKQAETRIPQRSSCTPCLTVQTQNFHCHSMKNCTVL